MNVWKSGGFPLRIKAFRFFRVKTRKTPCLVHPNFSSWGQMEKEFFCDAVIEICVGEERECVFWGT